ncbi:MAG: tyrosine-type recombinase/integrase, partial [Verrucomicrobiota bacterium]
LRKVIGELSEKVTGNGLEVPSVDKFLTSWIRHKEFTGSSAGTLERYGHTVNAFILHLKEKAKMPITGITTSHIQEFAQARRENGAAPKTVIVDIKTLSTAFNRAEALMLILKNPVKAVELPKAVSSEREIFTHAQFIQLVNAVPSYFKGKEKGLSWKTVSWKTLLLLGYYTGARLSDCVHLKWEDFSPKKGIILCLQKKTQKMIVLPVQIDLYQHLMNVALIHDEDVPKYLCDALNESSTGGNHGLSETFLRLVKHAGIEQQTIQGKGKRKFNRLTFHSLRHSFNTALYAGGIAQEDRMRLTGHSSITMNNRYTHLVDVARLHKAINVLPGITREDEISL